MTTRTSPGRAVLATALGVLLAAVLVPVPGFATPSRAVAAPTPQHDSVVAGHLAAATSSRTPSLKPYTAKAPVWPAASTVDVSLDSSVAAADSVRHRLPASVAASVTPQPVHAGSGPVTLTPSTGGSVSVRTFDRATAVAAGLDGVLVQLTGTSATPPGRVGVTIEYRGFAGAYGADWASRLRLVAVPACALRVPIPSGCRPTALASHNNLAAGTVSADVELASTSLGVRAASSAAPAGVMVAAVAGPASGAGTYAATSLKPSSSWTAGGNSGDFSWSYPMNVPPAPAMPTPTLGLSYSSSAVDGEMAATNNQPSWVGEGFSLANGFVERSFKTCADDMGGDANNTTASGDQCWARNGITMSLPGHGGGELVPDNTDGNRWHLRNDDGTYIRHMTGASNGDNDGEWWVATVADGTQYWFGKNAAANNSAWTEPVYGNNPGEPCHASTFAASSCPQAYRWNLDHVVDRSGNTMDYYYTTETNKYAANNDTNNLVSYVRGGYLTKITYGSRTGGTGQPPMRVVFTTGDRCLSGCATHDAQHWPDTPWDQQCTAAPCQNGSPTFWSTVRLASMQTQLYSGSGTTYTPVTTWTFTHDFLDPGDGTRAGMWLSSLTQTGNTHGGATLPPVTFTPVQLSNRVDPQTTSDGLPPMKWMRMASITTETGEQIAITYNPSDCTPGGSMPDSAHLETNTLRCYPVRWTPPGSTSQITDFFNKYTVAQITDTDLTTPNNPTTVTTYQYIGNPAWHYNDDNGLVPDTAKTWSQWRGYATVETNTGVGSARTAQRTQYFQGMYGDHLPSGTRTNRLPAVDMNLNGSTSDPVDVPAINDEDVWAGTARTTTVLNGPGGAEVSAKVTVPWQSAPTATRTINNVTVNARFTGTAETHSRVDLDGGRAPRTSTIHTDYDGTYGQAIAENDYGDDAIHGDERCTRTTYNRNTPADGSVWIISTIAEVAKYATDCATAATATLTPAQVMSGTRNYFDGATSLTQPPTRGLSTEVDTLQDWVNGAGVFQPTIKTTRDAVGRIITNSDVRGNVSTTTYGANAGGQAVSSTVTNALGWVSTTVADPAFGTPLTTTDPNGRVTSETYDAFSRLTAVWKPGRDMATQSANITYSYLIRNNAPTVVTTNTLNPSGGYTTTYDLYDGLLRARQTQAPRGDGTTGAIVTDTFYDSTGQANKTYSPYLADITPGTTLFVPNEQNVPQRVETTRDGAGRTVQTTQFDPDATGTPVPYAVTTNAYGGDRIDVTPPTGGTATSTFSDAHGNPTEKRQYHGSTPTPSTPGSYDATTYAYNAKGQLISTTDAAGHTWTTTYDLSDRVLSTTDPNKGTTTTTYNTSGDVLTRADARGVTLLYTYDQIGRQTGLYQGSIDPANQLSAWTYDGVTNSRGQLTKTVSYDDGNAYSYTVNGFTVSYQPSSVTYTIPASETGLAGSYTYVYTYNVDGTLATTRLPDVDGTGGLGTETLTQQYSTLGQPAALLTSIPSSTTLVSAVEYTGYGELATVSLQHNGGSQAFLADTYLVGTRKLAEQAVTRQTSPTAVADVHYDYQPAGQVTDTSDPVSGDNQCFRYDYLQRLTSAWTPATADCASEPSIGTLGGPAPYWTDWTLNTTGDRTAQTAHQTAATTTYTYPAAGNPQPHALASQTLQDPTGTRTVSYGYDQSGNVTTRPDGASGTQTLGWNPQGHLATVNAGDSTFGYVYNVDGGRLVQRDGSGKTLYLPGQELRYTTTTGAKATTRYYSDAGLTVAMRTSAGLTWLFADSHGTVTATIDATTQATSTRRQDPYGNDRGTNGSNWPSALDRGFVGGTQDATGLTHLGAREYDPTIGRFISDDPVLDVTDPQQINGYAYANNAPTTSSDPDGQRFLTDYDGGSAPSTPRGCESWGDAVKNLLKDRYYECVNGVPDNPNMPGPDGSKHVTGVSAKSNGVPGFQRVLSRLGCFVGSTRVSCSGTEQYVDLAVQYATEAGVDPRLVLDILFIESEGIPIQRDTAGVGNMSEETFNQAKAYYCQITGKKFTGDYTKSKNDPALSIQALAWKLRELSDSLDRDDPDPVHGAYKRYELIAIGWNVGDAVTDKVDSNMDKLAKGIYVDDRTNGKASEYITKLNHYWDQSNDLICNSGAYTCTPTKY